MCKANISYKTFKRQAEMVIGSNNRIRKKTISSNNNVNNKKKIL
jgi:hypothetical protein